MGQRFSARQCLEYARLNWRLAERAEGEGNFALARELVALARDWDVQASRVPEEVAA